MPRRFSLPDWRAALALLALTMMSAPARSEGVATFNCHGSRNTQSCVATFRRGRVHTHVINAPELVDKEFAAAEERDRRWLKRCGAVIQQDRYGMPRYSYRARGCEFGLLD
jgi:hypothetical protein